MIFCFGYNQDLENAYAFYCSRYENISFDEFLKLPINEAIRKISSVPKGEPLYDIIKSRTINISKIKDKEEKKYWREQKRINEIPHIFLSDKEINNMLSEAIQNNKIGGKRNGKGFN